MVCAYTRILLLGSPVSASPATLGHFARELTIALSCFVRAQLITAKNALILKNLFIVFVKMAGEANFVIKILMSVLLCPVQKDRNVLTGKEPLAVYRCMYLHI